VRGYGTSVQSTGDPTRSVKGDLDEYSHGPKSVAFPDCVPRTLRLPVKDAPAIPWGDPKSGWANVEKFGAKGDGQTDDTAAVQRAIDSGAHTVYFPGGKDYRCKNLIVRGKVRRFIACEAYVTADRIDVRDGSAPAVLIERFMPNWNNARTNIYQQSRRALIVRDVNAHVYQDAPGDVFIDDVCGGLYMNTPGASAWCRYFNYEVSPELGIINRGGKLWIMGSKIEHPNPQVELLAGSKTEIFGAMWYAGFGDVVVKPGMRIVDAAVTLVAHRQHSFGSGRWKTWIEIEREGKKTVWTDWALDFLSTATEKDLRGK
jgi:hypothetical protein